MITCESLKSALDSKEAGGRGTKTYDRLFQEYNGTMLTGRRARCKLFSKKDFCFLLKLINVFSY